MREELREGLIDAIRVIESDYLDAKNRTKEQRAAIATRKEELTELREAMLQRQQDWFR